MMRCRCFSLSALLMVTILAVACAPEQPTIQLVEGPSDMVEVPAEVLEAATAGRRTFDTGGATVLYVHFDGITITHANTSDSSTNRSFIGGGTVPAFVGDQATRDKVVQLVRQLYAAYDIQVVTSRPSSGYYDMVVVGGSPQDLGLNWPSGVAGVAPMDCGNQMPRDISFVFSDNIRAIIPPAYMGTYYAQKVAETAAHESAHCYGLPHSDVGCDLMSYASCQQLKTFLDQDMPMQSDSYGKCGMTSMNSHQLLLSELGASTGGTQPPPPSSSDSQAPQVSITEPGDGATLNTQISIKVSASDNVGVTAVELLVNGQLAATDNTAPYAFGGTIKAGQYTIEARARDAAGNTASDKVSVTVSDSSTAPPPPSDTQAPQVAITSPADGATVESMLTVKATASDNDAVTSVELVVDGKVMASRSTAPYEFPLSLQEGTHQIEVRAQDPSGNEGKAAVSVTVQTAAAPSPTDPSDPQDPQDPTLDPGTYGAPCDGPDDCDSGLCAEDPNGSGRYCTEPCDPDSNTCPESAGCYPAGSLNVCGPPATDSATPDPGSASPAAGADAENLSGGCSVAGAGASPWASAPWLLGLLLLVTRRRRRR